jgi:hypothetical protein
MLSTDLRAEPLEDGIAAVDREGRSDSRKGRINFVSSS